tara:strand:- start:108 stop:689 length:582 start_codon:yes stop_codon:yes gene_type:complete
MEDNILHKYPILKDERLFTDRYTKENFEKYTQINLENYEKWKIGINFKTNRKIKIGGKTHIRLGYENFYIKGFLFTKLNDINIELYIQETERLKNEILSYNLKVPEIICKINKLEKWSDFVEFEGIKYGIQKVYNDIHRENDCNGNINKEIVCWECRWCRGSASFIEPCRCSYTTNIECVKCGYKEERYKEEI